MPLSLSSRSTARFSPAGPRCGWVWTVMDDTSTTCSTPACRAASRMSASGPIRERRNSERTPSSAGFSEAGQRSHPQRLDSLGKGGPRSVTGETPQRPGTARVQLLQQSASYVPGGSGHENQSVLPSSVINWKAR